MITIRLWVLLLYSVALGAGVWMIARHYDKSVASWIHDAGPAAPDPYEHVLAITGAFELDCDNGCGAGASAEYAGVSWHLSTSAPTAGLPDPLPELEGSICVTGTWGTPAERCTAPFEITVGEIDKVYPEYMVVHVQPPPASTAIAFDLMVGAKRSSPTQRPAMEPRAHAEFLVVQPLGPHP